MTLLAFVQAQVGADRVMTGQRLTSFSVQTDMPRQIFNQRSGIRGGAFRSGDLRDGIHSAAREQMSVK